MLSLPYPTFPFRAHQGSRRGARRTVRGAIALLDIGTAILEKLNPDLINLDKNRCLLL